MNPKNVVLFLALLTLALAFNFCGCSTGPDNPAKASKVSQATSGPLPDLTGGKPFLAGNCVADAKIAYAILDKLGAHPHLLQIDYLGPGPNSKTNDTRYGHVLIVFSWDGSYSAWDRTSGRILIPSTVDATNAKAVATFLFWTTFYSTWTTLQLAHI